MSQTTDHGFQQQFNDLLVAYKHIIRDSRIPREILQRNQAAFNAPLSEGEFIPAAGPGPNSEDVARLRMNSRAHQLRSKSRSLILFSDFLGRHARSKAGNATPFAN